MPTAPHNEEIMTTSMQYPDFLIIPYQLLADANLVASDRIVYAIVYWFANMKLEKCTASNVTLGKFSMIDPKQVGKCLVRLEENGYIQRIYSDPETMKNRTEIVPLVAFTKNVVGKGYRLQAVPPGSGTGTAHRRINVPPAGGQRSNTKSKRNSIAASAAAATPAPPFNATETKTKWYEGDKEDFQLLAWFFDQKGLWKKFDSRAKVEHAVQRHIRSCRRIVNAGWSQGECEKAASKMKENEKLRSEWTLETLEKYLTK